MMNIAIDDGVEPKTNVSNKAALLKWFIQYILFILELSIYCLYNTLLHIAVNILKKINLLLNV
jgi:hypothetical protein